MKMIKKLNDLSLSASIGVTRALSTLGLGFVAGECFAGEGVNRLDGLKPDIQATFGTGSDVEYVLYIAEALSVAYAFHKTKSYPVFAALPVLMVFTHWALK